MNWKSGVAATTILAGVLTSAYYAFNIYGWLQRPRPDIVATVSYGPIVHPPDDAHPMDGFEPTGFERIIVRNDGSETAQDVRLSAPDADEYEVSSSDLPKDRLVNGATVSLGSMEPLASYTVTAFMLADGGDYAARQVRVVYADGVGRVSLEAPKELPWFGVVDQLVAFIVIPTILLWIFVRPPRPPRAPSTEVERDAAAVRKSDADRAAEPPSA